MKAATAPLFAVLLAAPSAPQHGMYFTGMPPERFRGDGVAVVVFTSDVAAVCGEASGETVYACTTEIAGHRVIVLPNPCALGDVEWSARMACHEHAHYNFDWSAFHEVD